MPRVTVKGQVTIPKEIREALGLEPGSRVRFKIEGNSCVLEKEVEADPFTRWVGYLKGNRSSDEIIEELRGKSGGERS